MEDLLRDYYRRFSRLPETVRLLVLVSFLGVWCLYMLGLISLIAAPRLRQAPVAYAEAIVVTATFTPTEIPAGGPLRQGTRDAQAPPRPPAPRPRPPRRGRRPRRRPQSRPRPGPPGPSRPRLPRRKIAPAASAY